MSLLASSCFSEATDSEQAGADAARSLREAFATEPLKAIIVYATVSHDATVFLRRLRADIGADIPIFGCSTQGVVGQGSVRETGYLLGAMGLGGTSLRVGAALERDIDKDTRAKGRKLGARTLGMLGDQPNTCVVLYDPLCNVDVDELLAGLGQEITCPLVGGGAGQPFGPIVRTYQYWQGEVLEHSAMVIGLAGPFSADLGVCHGTSPTGLTMTVTRCDKNTLLEIDGRPAIEVWKEITGCSDDEISNQDYVANWAIGIERTLIGPNGDHQLVYFVRASFGFDTKTGAVMLQAAIPEGTKIMMHHRAIPAVTDGTALMGRDLAARLKGRRPWAVLGFECGARTSPFLGAEETRNENVALQRAIGPEAPWLGMMAWGEIAPAAGKAAFHNYTYPLLVLSV
jgi:hypothetical protein